MSYSFVTTLLLPIAVLYTLKIAWRYRSLRYLKQRLGFSYPELSTSPIWAHCASVGEVNTFIPLLKLMVTEYPNTIFLVTTNTVTGARVLNKHNIKNTHHSYLPIDTRGAVNRFLNSIKPKLALIMETEIWPELFNKTHEKNIPISIINGRLSHKTLNASKWIKKQYKSALSNVDRVYTRSNADQEAYLQLGSNKANTQKVGNLKFAQAISDNLKETTNFTDRSYVLAASTHDNEEYLLASLWKEKIDIDKLLVIVPRHPERTPSILKQLKPLDLNIACRSKNQKITQTTDIYLADTIGELTGFIKGADTVFMGGSLIPHGGQNLLEPASMSKPIICGPHMFNFSAEVSLLLENNACIQVSNTDELSIELNKLLSDSSKQDELGRRAKETINKESSIAEKYLKILSEHYSSLPPS